ncbi:MAG: class I SAM-dependent methyltransferase [Ferruginibacter sp.]
MKNSLSGILRKAGLLYAADHGRFFFQKARNYHRNKQFRKQYPAFALPPDYFLYETFTLDYHEYMQHGKCNAAELTDLIRPLIDLSVPGKRILDWGCGPARVVRHLPELLLHQHLIYGTDYNTEYINWCSKDLPGITFTANKLYPPLAFDDNYFDVIYSISILTHLSEKNHYEWISEIKRVLKTGGIFIVTTQGSAYIDKMLKREINEFENGNLVTRNYQKEGHRIFSAFQPESFMRNLFNDFEIIEFQQGATGHSIHGKQDTWIVQKK